MPVIDSRVLFIHIPKCGGTSVEVSLGVANEYPDIGLSPTMTRPNYDTLFGGGLQHLSIREIVSNYNTKAMNAFRFSIIRDCVDRFVSHVVWKHYRFKNLSTINSEIMKIFHDELLLLVGFAERNDLFRYPYDGLLYCEKNINSIPINGINRHLVPQCCYLYDHGKIAIDKIFTIDEMDKVEDMLLNNFAFKKPIPQRMVGTMSKGLRCRISESTEAMIRSIYKYDEGLLESVRHNTIR